MNMKNVKSIEDYVEENIRHYYNFSNVINESIIKDFYEDVFKGIVKITNEWILVINSSSFAERLSKESKDNKIVCIHFDKDFLVPDDSTVQYRYVNFYMNDNEISAETSKQLKEVYSEFNKIDKIFNFSLPMENGLRYEYIAKFNYQIFLIWFIPGITSWFSFDELDVQEQFAKTVYNNNEYKCKIGPSSKISNDVWVNAGFKGKEDRHITHIFIRESGHMGELSAEEMDKADNVNGYTDFQSGLLKHYIEPRIYCFRTDLVDSVIAPRKALKVGDTDRGVSVRLGEWEDKFPGLEPINDWSAVVSGCGDGLDGKVFRDYAIHKILEGKGWNKTRLKESDFGEENIANKRYSNEFFFDTTADDVEKAINYLHKLIKNSRYDIISKLKDKEFKKRNYIDPIHNKTLKFKERKLQTDTIEKFVERYVEGDKDLLMYAVMRFGKTYTACRCAQEFGGKFTVVVSAKADVRGEWLAAVNPYIEFKDYDMYLASGDGSLYNMLNGITTGKKGKKKVEDTEIKKYATVGEYIKDHPEKHVMLFLTLQDLNRYVNGTKSDKGKKYYDCFIDYPVSLLIIDEAHYGPQGKEYGKGIGEGWDKEETDEKDSNEFSNEETARLINTLNLTDTVKLHLSGTPYDLVARGKFDNDSIIAKFGFEDLMDEKQKWIDDNLDKLKRGEVRADQNPYFGIPNMINFGYKFSDFDLKHVMDEGTVNFINLFKVIKNEKGEYKFKYETEILNMLKAIDGSDRKEGVMAILDSPSLKQEKMCKHIVMVLPRKRICDVMAQLLEDNKDVLKNLGEYHVVKIASEQPGGGLETEDAKDIIRAEDEAGNKTISLTVIQMLTGVSVKEWDTMFYMKDGTGAQSYDQARFRVQTPNIGEREVLDLTDFEHVAPVRDEDGKVVTVKVDKKPQTLFVDFSIKRTYKVLYDRFHTECLLEGETDEEKMFDKIEEKLKRYIKHMPIVANNLDQIQEVGIENVMKRIFEAYSSEHLKGDTFDEQVMSINWKKNLDFSKIDYSPLAKLDSSYRPGKSSRPGLEGDMTLGDPTSIVNGEVAEADKAEWEKEFDEEEKELDIEKPVEVEDTTPEDSDYEDSDSEYEGTDGVFDEEKAKEDIENISNTLMKNIMIYMLCRNDNVSVFKNIHDLVWDSMRHEANYGVILNIFDPKHSKEKNPKIRAWYVQQVRKLIMWWNEYVLKKNDEALQQVIAMIVSACLSKEERNDFNSIKDKLKEFGKGAIGDTEFITPDEVSEKLLDENFVIFNNDSKVLDCYGSKTGEILYYIYQKYPDFNIDNYFLICKNGWVAELNKSVMKLVLANQGKKFGTMEKLANYLNEHILIFDPDKDNSEIPDEDKGVKFKKSVLRDIMTKRALHLEYALKNKKTDGISWWNMKYDCILGNPPYDGNLHLKIINSVLPMLDKDGTASFIHPARWLQDPLAEDKKRETDKVKFKYIVDRLDDVKVIDNKIVSSKFNILFSGDLMLSKIKHNPTHKNISIFNDIANECISIIVDYSKDYNIAQHDERDKIDGWRCQIDKAILFGDKNHRLSDKEADRKGRCNFFGLRKNNVFEDGRDENGRYWTETRAKNQFTKSVGTPFPHSIKFNSKEEALNFQASCNTNFFSNIIYLLKFDQATPLDFLPWMEDYSHTWTDEDYCKFFAKYGMSEECQKWMCRDVYDYRIKDFINYMKFDDSKIEEEQEEYSETPVEPDSSPSGSVSSKTVLDN